MSDQTTALILIGCMGLTHVILLIATFLAGYYSGQATKTTNTKTKCPD